jgi:hypothetical protein
MELVTLHAFGDELSKLAGASDELREQRQAVRPKMASFADKTVRRFERMSDIVAAAAKAKEEADIRRTSKPFYTELTQDEEPGPYLPYNPPPVEPEIIYG